jgi:hypothetical protein
MGDSSLPVDRAASVKAPTMVIVGGVSFPFMRETARALADALPDGRTRASPQSSGWGIRSNPREALQRNVVRSSANVM